MQKLRAQYPRWETKDNFQVIWIYGERGTGKTTLAENYFNKNNIEYWKTTRTHNNEHYEGQKGVLFDDLVLTDANFTQVIHMLDSGARIHISTKYSCEKWKGETIIITSTLDPQEAAEQANLTGGAVPEQLIRRISTVYHLRTVWL